MSNGTITGAALGFVAGLVGGFVAKGAMDKKSDAGGGDGGTKGGGKGDGGGGGGQKAAWVRADVLNPGDHVRASLTVADLAKLAGTGQFPGITPDLDGFKALLAVPIIRAALAAGAMQVWGPGPRSALPSDWPTDDAGAEDEYHADFTYKGAAAIGVSQIPFLPAKYWKLAASFHVGNGGGGTPRLGL